jgi:predicted flap endonuclease-1-like 5' DNA nuclease
MKAAIKGGLDLADAARELAVVASRQWDLRVTAARPAPRGDSAPATGDADATAGSDGHPTPAALIQVDGIGPGVSGVLSKAGITTVAQLAATDVAQLRDLLRHAGRPYQSMDPTPWPERARRLLAPAPDTGAGAAGA